MAQPSRLATSLTACRIIRLFHVAATPQLYTLSLHDALPISVRFPGAVLLSNAGSRTLRLSRHDNKGRNRRINRSEEHTSELQSRFDLVCRLLLEKKKKKEFQQVIVLRSGRYAVLGYGCEYIL